MHFVSNVADPDAELTKGDPGACGGLVTLHSTSSPAPPATVKAAATEPGLKVTGWPRETPVTGSGGVTWFSSPTGMTTSAMFSLW